MAAIAAIGALYFSNSTLSASNDQLGLARRTAQSEQLKSATEQLDSDKVSVRLSGVYLLERLALDSADDRLTLRRLIEAFVRTETTNGPCELSSRLEGPVDIQAALVVIVKYGAASYPSPIVNLAGACLPKTSLPGADMRRFSLGRADLRYAYLNEANFTDAHMAYTNLAGAALLKVNFTNTELEGANLSNAFLQGANLQGANLQGANLTGVVYDDSTRWPQGFTPPPSA